MKKITVITSVSLGILAVVAVLLYFWGIPTFIKGMIAENMLNEPRLVAGEGDYQGAAYCATCHQDKFDQWSQSLHSKAYTEAHFEPRVQQLSWGMDKELCLNCHSPSPRLVEGVSCEVCHGPAQTMEVVKDVCVNCHGSSSTIKDDMLSTPAEFLQSTAHKEGKSCVDCHMRDSEGAVFHAFQGSRAAPEVYRGVAEVERIEQRDGQLMVAVRNKVLGHYLPTGAPENILFLEIEGYDDQSKAVYREEIKFEKSAFWFRNMPMQVTGDNRLKDGELRELTFDLPQSLSRVKATLKIKPILWSGEIAEIEVDSYEQSFP
jgi:hypothetical protein